MQEAVVDFSLRTPTGRDRIVGLSLLNQSLRLSPLNSRLKEFSSSRIHSQLCLGDSRLQGRGMAVGR
jgi:hypothetical protein